MQSPKDPYEVYRFLTEKVVVKMRSIRHLVKSLEQIIKHSLDMPEMIKKGSYFNC